MTDEELKTRFIDQYAGLHDAMNHFVVMRGRAHMFHAIHEQVELYHAFQKSQWPSEKRSKN